LRKARFVVLAVAILTLVPLNVQASGIVLGRVGSNSACNYPQPVDGIELASSTVSYVVPVSGRITTWSFWTEWKATVALEVWRPTAIADTFSLHAISPTKTVLAGSGINTFHVSRLHPISVKPGDRIGVHMAAVLGAPSLSCAYYTFLPTDVFAWVYDASKPRLGTVVTFNPASANPALLNIEAVVG
jgi:hypothetical protein